MRSCSKHLGLDCRSADAMLSWMRLTLSMKNELNLLQLRPDVVSA